MIVWFRERYRRPTWDWPVPADDHKLSDADVEFFVKTVLPAALQCMGSVRLLKTAAEVLQMLSLCRPDLVIPRILERFVNLSFVFKRVSMFKILSKFPEKYKSVVGFRY